MNGVKKMILFSLTVGLILAAIFDMPNAASVSEPERFSYEIYDRLTRTYVDEKGNVNYEGLKRELPALREFADLLAKVSPENRPELFPDLDDKKRYYLTAYNAMVLYHATINYPDKHVLWSRLGYFKDKDIVLGGKKISLNYLEHEIIRKQFLDPRIHFYINCGAKSCPPIRKGAIGEKLTEDELEQSAIRFINDPGNVKFDARTRTLYLSKIFDWFSSDFINYLKVKRGLEKPHISQYIALYLKGEAAEALARVPLDQLKVKHLDYDKSLNEQ